MEEPTNARTQPASRRAGPRPTPAQWHSEREVFVAFAHDCLLIPPYLWLAIRTALPDLLDRTLDEPLQLRINRVLAEHFEGYDSMEWCRSRQSSSRVEIDIGLGFPADRAFGEVAAFARRFADRIEAEIPSSEATVTPVLPRQKAGWRRSRA